MTNLSGCGNHVADYKTEIVVCDKCEGEGLVSADRDEIKAFVISKFWQPFKSGKAKHVAKAALREWHKLKKLGKLECWHCEGRGRWERWY